MAQDSDGALGPRGFHHGSREEELGPRGFAAVVDPGPVPVKRGRGRPPKARGVARIVAHVAPAQLPMGLDVWFRPTDALHSELVTCLQLEPQLDTFVADCTKIYEHLFGMRPRTVSSWEGESQLLQIPESTLRERMPLTASIIFQTSKMHLRGLFNLLTQAFDYRELVPDAIFMDNLFDETPMFIRAKEDAWVDKKMCGAFSLRLIMIMRRL